MIILIWNLSGMDVISGEVTLLKLFCLHYEKRSTLKGNKLEANLSF